MAETDIITGPTAATRATGTTGTTGADRVPLLSLRQKVIYGSGAALWMAALGYFWLWWLEPAHNIGTAAYLINTSVLVWMTLLPLYFLVVFLRARVSGPEVNLPEGSRVAMVVTKAPSEPFWLVRRTLEAMLRQDYPHDTWLADEDPDDETLAWCAAHSVRVSTRKGVSDYHRSTWPRRTRCKEGNLAYFYDHYGYELYDFVVQMDADHVPTETYLREMLKPFADPRVGYVSAPSICDQNARESWSARGRLYVEGSLHGLLQAGYNAGWAPLCIGSHYAVRTRALKEIGGLGPELAEDHSTTLMMNAHGWRGMHAFNAIAHGDGPRTFVDLITQEFQWSRSLVMILLAYSPTYVPKLPPRLRFQFLFCQLWYPLFAVFMLLMYLIPILALTMRDRFADVTFVAFYLHFVALELILLVMGISWRSNGWFRPFDAKILSWEAVLFKFARWPWVLAGVFAALRDWMTGSFVDFRVTPKGTDLSGPLPFRVLAPYVVLAAASALAVIGLHDVGAARGFYIFAILNCVIYVILTAVIVIRHAIENKLRWMAPSPLIAQTCLAAVLFVMPVTAATLRGADGLSALTWGSDWLQVTNVTYSASGAGMRGDRIRKVRLKPVWSGN